jgi:hypothetical protein
MTSKRPATPKPPAAPTSDRLTPAEIEALQQNKREQIEQARKHWANHPLTRSLSKKGATEPTT